MAMVSEAKTFDVEKSFLVIRRCPFCLRDTEQQAYYAHNPDLRIGAIEYRGRMPFEWYGIEECRECGNAYVAQGVVQKLNKEITGKTEKKEMLLAYTCCDFCLHEENSSVLANMLITLRNGRSIYMCERHAEQIKKEKGKKDNYDFLIKRTESWASPSSP